MTIVGAFILPHGSMILDPEKEDIPKEAISLHHEMTKIAQEIDELNPDIIFLTTPHSIALSNDYALYLNQGGWGTAEWQGEYKDFVVQILFDQNLTNELLANLYEKQRAISGLACFTAGIQAPLRWGEAVPLWFLRNLSSEPKYVLLSQPLRRLDQPKELIAQTLTLGEDLQAFFEEQEQRIVVIISADLSHTHQQEGPYGYNDEAEPSDQLFEQWANTLDESILTKTMVPKLDHCLCCGFIGFLLLQGMIGAKGFSSEVVMRATPSYYGMMIAKYLRENR
ncbi:MAG: hypothetical protein GF308_19665 [Candidatus Heimdallarchaeota archaeon]|nr:hypothetical protein [Candidatus Heimdallarchaeota archaeon]